MSPMRTPRETLQRRRQPWSSRLKRSRRHCLTKLELHLSHSPSSRWYIGPTSLHLSSLCTWQIVQLHVVWLFQSTGCTLLSWLLFVIQFLLPQNWLQLREGGADRLGTALESHFVLVLALVLLVLIVLLVLAAALELHCPLPCNFPAPTCNLPLVGSYENWKTEYQLLD